MFLPIVGEHVCPQILGLCTQEAALIAAVWFLSTVGEHVYLKFTIFCAFITALHIGSLGYLVTNLVKNLVIDLVIHYTWWQMW